MKKQCRWMLLLISVIAMFFAMSSVAYGASQTNINNVYIYVSSSSYSYTGEEIKASVTVKKSAYGSQLREGTDYSLSYSNNINAGEASVTITGQGDYTGSVTKKFTIRKQSIWYNSKVKISVAEATYTGYNITPRITMTFNGKVMTENVDYTVEQKTAKDAGSYRIQITGKGNFEDSTTENFYINKKPISECTVSVSDQKYTGRALKPTVTVYNGSMVVPSGEYSVSYSNNTDIGTATVTVSADYSAENYTGKGTGTFKIKYDIAKCIYTIGTCTYTGSAVTPEVTIKQGNKTLTKGVDYTMQISNNVNAGQGTIQITGTGYYLGTATKTFTINPKDIALTDTALKLSEEKYVYNGTAFTPNVEVSDGTTALVQDKDYTLTYEKNKNPGYAYAILNGKGNYGKTKKLKFAIYPSTPKISKVKVDDNNTVTIQWKKGPDGLKYIVYRNGKEIGTSKKNAVSYKDTNKKTNGRNYAYTIAAVPAGAKSLLSETSEAKNSFYLKAPKAEAKVSGSRMLTVSWSKNKQADGYQLQWSTSPKFAKKKTVTIKDAQTLKKTLSGLAVGRKYYFRVRAYKTVTEEYEVVKPVSETQTAEADKAENIGQTEMNGTNVPAETVPNEPEKEIKTKKVKYYSSWSNTAVKAPITASAQSAAS